METGILFFIYFQIQEISFLAFSASQPSFQFHLNHFSVGNVKQLLWSVSDISVVSWSYAEQMWHIETSSLHTAPSLKVTISQVHFLASETPLQLVLGMCYCSRVPQQQ